MSKSSLLALLANGEFRSGPDLAHILGVSRTAVWKQVKKIVDDCGLPVESVKGRGYRIPGGVDLLEASQVLAAMTPRSRALMTQLAIADSVDSTNAAILRHRDGASGLVCTAEQQTAGRGRRGRAWVSPYASNIYLSLLWEFEQGAAALEGLSLAVGVAVVKALQSCGVPTVQLKWPNDVLYRGAKLGGILLEMQGDVAGACRVVIGVGLNVCMPVAAAAAIDQDWTDIATITGGQHCGRNQLLGAILTALLPMVADFSQQGFAHWQDDWQALDAFADKPVLVDTGGLQMTGIARGADARGALLLETDSAVQAIFGGEVTLRAAP